MKILVTGASGQLGFAVCQRLKALNIECKGTYKNDFDLTNRYKTVKYIEEYNPDAVIHCAAYTAVDKAETEKDECFDVNVNGTQNIASACGSIDAKLMYISTDYVFDGRSEEPYGTDAKPNPINYYGYSKYHGELAVKALRKVFIVRTSWVFGENGNNFVETMLGLGRQGKPIRVVDDQIGSPTYTKDLAVLLCEMIHNERYGMYHAANEGFCSWFDYAKFIFECADIKVELIPVKSAAYVTAALRPKNSRLSKRSLDMGNFPRLPGWKDAVKRYLINKSSI